MACRLAEVIFLRLIFATRRDFSVFCALLQFNFVGRILGPRGMTAKQLEQDTGCKIMVRGKGSMRDRKKVRHLDGRTDGRMAIGPLGPHNVTSNLRLQFRFC